jgi:hypothetical protein
VTPEPPMHVTLAAVAESHGTLTNDKPHATDGTVTSNAALPEPRSTWQGPAMSEPAEHPSTVRVSVQPSEPLIGAVDEHVSVGAGFASTCASTMRTSTGGRASGDSGDDEHAANTNTARASFSTVCDHRAGSDRRVMRFVAPGAHRSSPRTPHDERPRATNRRSRSVLGLRP